MKRLIMATILVLLLTATLIPTAVLADDNTTNPGITVSNAGIVDVVSPGQTITQTMNVSIGANAPTTTVTVDVDGVAQSSNGTYILLNAAEDTNPDTARPFVSVNTNSFQLQPGGSQDVVATIVVPQDANLGGYFACIRITNPPIAKAALISQLPPQLMFLCI